MATVTVMFRRASKDRMAINFAYEPRLVELCKSVPSYARSYDPPTKTWTVDTPFAMQLAKDFKALGCKIAGLEEAQERARKAPPPPPPRAIEKSWAMALLEKAGDDREMLFRRFAKVLHSDVGGLDWAMQDLNVARKALNERDGNGKTEATG